MTSELADRGLIDRRKDRLLRLPAVRERTGLSTPTIYRRQADGTFPKSIRLGANAVAWYESDIDNFVACPFLQPPPKR